MNYSIRSVVRLAVLLIGVFGCSASAGFAQSQPLASRAVDLKDCIQLFITHQMVIKDRQAYLKAIRSDASRPQCLKDAERIDLEKNSLIGLDLNSGYCQVPAGLTHAATRDDNLRQIVLHISYIDGGSCRAVSSYYLWVLVPKIPDGFEVKFEITPRPPTDKMPSAEPRSLLR